ncbi:hypothetical protein TWF281_006959 [Arthrobotrys megalospora]
MVTKFTLYVNSDPTDTHRCTWTASDGPIHDNIVEFVEVITQMVNLEEFSWGSITHHSTLPPFSELSGPLAKVQKAFLNLRKLREMYINGYIFHPFFFLVPPPSVKKLIIGRDMMPAWWQAFATCPLTDLQVLTIQTWKYYDFPTVHAVDTISRRRRRLKFSLGDVAVCTLKRFSVSSGGFWPADLDECIMRRNPGLKQRSLRGIARRSVEGVVYRCTEELMHKNRECAISLLRNPPDAVTSSTGDLLQQSIAQEYIRLFTKDLKNDMGWSNPNKFGLKYPRTIEDISEINESDAGNERIKDIVRKCEAWMAELIFHGSNSLRGVLVKRFLASEQIEMRNAMSDLRQLVLESLGEPKENALLELLCSRAIV